MYDYNLFADIKKLLIESHTKEEIKNLSTSELKKLHKEYSEKDTDEAKKEADEIKKEINNRGEDDGEEKAKAAKKPDVAEQNEELLAILDTLCEMVGLDMMNLVELHASGEMTRDDFQNWLHAMGAGPRHTSTEDPKVAAARIKGAKKTAERIGTKSQRAAAAALAGAIKTGEETAYKIEMSGKDRLHEPTARRRAMGAPPVEINTSKFDGIQNSIEKIADKFTMNRKKKNVSNALKPFTLQPKPKGKGKGKK